MEKNADNNNTFQTSLRMPKELYDRIEALARKSERKPAEQIRFMLKKYLEVIEEK